ncbi:MAG TPA: PQQ-binding-like beta-propeller repeat protein, partial [Candidatus Tumulicola sp.]|nr:PQQ-binding-like beta-propeller repeat protein [Candidatus Tumulicola sp.]
MLWQHDLCDAGSTTFGASLALDPSGDVLVAGSFFQSAYIAKLSGATGDKIWDDVIAPSNAQRTALSIGASSNGDVRVATWQNDTITIFGYGSDGTLQFQRELTNSLGSAKLRGFAVDSAGFSVVSEFDTDGNNQTAGRISRIDNFGSFVWQVQGAGGHVATDSAGNVIAGGINAVIEYDAATGTALWTVAVPATAVIADAQGNVFATGTWGVQPDDDIVTSKIGSDGTILWSHAYVDPGHSGNGASIALDASGNPVATGFGSASSGSATVQTTLKYSTNDGHVLWTATDQDSLGGSFPYAVNAGSGGAATVGSIFNASTGGLGGIYAIRYADGGTTTKVDPVLALASSANPSTAGDSVTFTATVTGSAGTPSGSVTFLDGSTAICS